MNVRERALLSMSNERVAALTPKDFVCYFPDDEEVEHASDAVFELALHTNKDFHRFLTDPNYRFHVRHTNSPPNTPAPTVSGSHATSPKTPQSLESRILSMSPEELSAMTVQEMMSYSDREIDALSRAASDTLKEANYEVWCFAACDAKERRRTKKAPPAPDPAAAPWRMTTPILEEFKRYFHDKAESSEYAQKTAMAHSKEVIKQVAEKGIKPLHERIKTLEDKTASMASASPVATLENTVLELRGKLDKLTQQNAAQDKLIASLQRRLDSMLAAQVAAAKK